MTKRSQKVWLALAILLVVMVGLRLALPGWVQDQLNSRMDRMGDYHGHIDDVAIRLWAGAYTLRGVTVTKQTADVPVPFFSGEQIDIALSWKALLDGGVVATVGFEQPELNFVDDEGDASQAGVGVDWRHQLEQLVPIRLDEITIHNGKVHFRNFSTDPQVDLTAQQVEGYITNLTNVRDLQGKSADFDLTATLFGQAPVEFNGRADPFNVLRDFHYKMVVSPVELSSFNEFLQAYANIDVESGTGTFLMELEAQDDQLRGYAKPLFKDIKVFSWEHDVEDDNDGPFRAVWEALVGGIENLFKNQSEDQLATYVEIEGELGDAETSTLQVIAGILRNAFVEAYRPSFEDLPGRESAHSTGRPKEQKAGS